MSRIRTIKPEFFTSEDIIALTPLARLFYVSLWCESDREGRLVWKPQTFKFRYFPGDDCNISTLAKELTDRKLLVLYETTDGKTYAEIPSFKSHQVINNRESESILPPREKDALKTRESGVQAEGKEGRKGREGNPRDDATPTKPKFKPPTVEEVRGYCLERKNSVDPARFVDFYTSKDWMVGKSRMKDWRASVRTWESKDQKEPAYGAGAI